MKASYAVQATPIFTTAGHMIKRKKHLQSHKHENVFVVDKYTQIHGNQSGFHGIRERKRGCISSRTWREYVGESVEVSSGNGVRSNTT